MFNYIILPRTLSFEEKLLTYTKRVKPPTIHENKHQSLGYYKVSPSLKYNSLTNYTLCLELYSRLVNWSITPFILDDY